MTYSLGAIPDRHDPRDYQFQIPLARAHEAATTDRKFYTMVNPDFRIDQGNEGTCVGHRRRYHQLLLVRRWVITPGSSGSAGAVL